MHNVARQRVRLVWQMSLAAAIVWPFPGTSLAQTGSADHQEFAGIDESLMHKADVLLATPAIEGKGKAGMSTRALEGKPPGASAANTANHQQVDDRKGNSAHARLEEWRPVITPILEEEGVPAELAAVVLIESGGNPAALSQKGARGLWQLMPETARRYGLTVDNMVDERLNVEKATHAAVRYLKDLYVQFGSWPLALAAYNTGEQNLQRAIDKSRSNEFSVLSALGLLPLETRNYVPAVLTAMQFTRRPFVLADRRPSTTNIVFALDGN